jgi:uncharacterized protein YegP (UPF0339 family)
VRHRLDVYRRDDGLWGWRLHCATGRVVAQDGGDGYRDRAAAAVTARDVLAGDLEVVIEEEPPLAVLDLALATSPNGNGHAHGD